MAEPTYQPRLWHLIATAFVAAFGVVVVWLVLNPRVEDDYRNYYIDRSWSCFPRIISHHYPLGEPVTFVKDRPGYARDSIRWCGFMPAKNDGIKSFGEYGILKLKFDIPDEPLLFTFSSWANTHSGKPARDVDIVVNDTKIGVVTYKDAKRVIGNFIIPADVAKSAEDGMVEIRWVVPIIAPPGTNTEPVTLQVRLEAIRLVPLSKAPPPATTPVAEPAPKRDGPRWNDKGGNVVDIPASTVSMIED
jgi:hypothetical protein